jgi:PEP-CTERM motif
MRWIFFTVLQFTSIIIVLLGFPRVAQADLATLNYGESPCKFEWQFRWTPSTGSLSSGGTAWVSSVEVSRTGDRFNFKIISRHNDICDTGDQPQMKIASFVFDDISITGTRENFGPLLGVPPTLVVDHSHIPGEHFDIFNLNYTNPRPGLGPWDFRLIGEHTSVPEPTTLLLLGTGLSGVITAARGRRKSGKGKDA